MFTPESPQAEGQENRQISLHDYTFDVERCDDPALFAVTRIVDGRGYEVTSRTVPVAIRRELTQLMRGTEHTSFTTPPFTHGKLADFSSDSTIAA